MKSCLGELSTHQVALEVGLQHHWRLELGHFVVVVRVEKLGHVQSLSAIETRVEVGWGQRGSWAGEEAQLSLASREEPDVVDVITTPKKDGLQHIDETLTGAPSTPLAMANMRWLPGGRWL